MNSWLKMGRLTSGKSVKTQVANNIISEDVSGLLVRKLYLLRLKVLKNLNFKISIDANLFASNLTQYLSFCFIIGLPFFIYN